jgi:hypothetical protein
VKSFLLSFLCIALVGCATMPESITEITSDRLLLNINNTSDASIYDLKSNNVEMVDGINPMTRGMRFNGRNSQFTGVLATYPEGNPTITYSFRIKTLNKQEYDKSIINIGSRNHNDRNGIILMGNNKFKFVAEGNDWISKYVLPIGEWKHIVIKKAGTMISLYVDGRLIESGSLVKGTNLKSAMFSIGSSYDEEFFDGIISDLYIFERSLKSLEIKFLSLN